MWVPFEPGCAPRETFTCTRFRCSGRSLTANHQLCWSKSLRCFHTFLQKDRYEQLVPTVLLVQRSSGQNKHWGANVWCAPFSLARVCYKCSQHLWHGLQNHSASTRHMTVVAFHLSSRRGFALQLNPQKCCRCSCRRHFVQRRKHVLTGFGV